MLAMNVTIIQFYDRIELVNFEHVFLKCLIDGHKISKYILIPFGSLSCLVVIEIF